jgi:hypothetical protein
MTKIMNLTALPSPEGADGLLIARATDGKWFRVPWSSVAAPAWADVTGKPAFATVATSGSYGDLTGIPGTFTPSAHTHTLSQITDAGTAAGADSGDFATAAQGTLAATAVQPGDSPSFGSITVTGTVDGRDVAADGSKLDGVATGATANATDAALRDRSTHTGTQAAGTITGLATVATSGSYGDLSGIPSTFAPAAHNQAWSTITSTPTTLAGYGITDAATAAQGSLANSAVQPGDDVSDLGETATAKIMTGAERTKLAGIETGADVTDTANVTSAGALMDSEVTNLADVKSFDPADYATAAQGGLADSALQLADIVGTVSQSGGAPTGAIIERGSNANGTYLRFADGTQICRITVSLGSIVANGSGTLASPYSTNSVNLTWPAAFAAGTTPITACTGYVPSASVVQSERLAAGTIRNADRTTARQCTVTRLSSDSTVQDGWIDIIGTGDWF